MAPDMFTITLPSLGLRRVSGSSDFQLFRAVQRYGIVLLGFTYNAATIACEKGQQHQLALHLLRAVERHASVLDMLTYNVPSAWAIRTRSRCRPYIYCERGSDMQTRRLRPPRTQLLVNVIRASRAGRHGMSCER